MNKLAAITVTFTALTLLPLSNAQTPKQAIQEISQSSNDPWEIKYVLFVAPEKEMREHTMRARSLNQQMASDKKLLYLNAQALFTPSYSIGPIAVELIRFTPKAQVVNAVAPLSQFAARRTRFDRMVFVKTRGRKDYHLYHFANWYDEDLEFPALCTEDDAEHYEETEDNGSEASYFGCVEWAKQLYTAEQPYIDVTSYTDEGPFIKHFMGWSRFTDTPKPVIGLNDDIWMCLYNCPNGELPGVIKDIAVWTRRHGLPLPSKKGQDED
jgi:hypothetical protein